MTRYPRRRRINHHPFEQDIGPFETRYGLPQQVSFCRRCVISNQRPNSAVEYGHTRQSTKNTIHFNAEKVCDACLMADRKTAEIDWAERERELRDLCNRYRRNDGAYDCVVPGSGGKDSFYAAHVLKHVYDMHPLTVTWAPHVYTEWGWKNFQAWIHAGFDNLLCTPNGQVHRLITRLAVENLFHPFQPFMLGQKSLAPKMAIQHKVPLVFYGESEAEYGNPIADTRSAQRDQSFFTAADGAEIFLGGTPISELRDLYGVNEYELQPYLPANPIDVAEHNISVHYLGYYLKWHPQSCYYYAVKHGGFQAAPERTPGTYSKYNSIDDKIDDFHYYTTHVKFGIGRATYDAAQEIRSGDITRDEGVSLVTRFDGEFPHRFASEIFEYLSLPEDQFPIASRMFEQPIMDSDYFSNLTDSFRPPHLWAYIEGKWQLRNNVSQENR